MKPYYAYLSPKGKHSDYHVHITIDEKNHGFRIYYYMAWWKGEKVSNVVFNRYSAEFKAAPLVSKRRSSVRRRANTYKRTGKAHLSADLLRNVFGFVEANTPATVAAKLEFVVNRAEKYITVLCLLKYRDLGLLPPELVKLPFFTHDPNHETVQRSIQFFDPAWVVRQSPQNTQPTAVARPQEPPVRVNPQ